MVTNEQADRRAPARWELLRNRNFMLLWAAYGVSAIGDHLSEMAILKTQNAVRPDVDVTPLDARMTFLFFVPFFLFGPFTGYLADRLPRRPIMIAADLARMGIMLSFATLMFWTSPWGQWGPFLPVLVVGTFAALFSPARSALLPTLVRSDQLVRANGMIAGLGIIGTMAALLMGGWLAQHYHPTFAFRLDAGTYLVSATLLVALHPPTTLRRSNSGPSGSRMISDIMAGVRYARCHRRVLELLAIACLVWFCGPLVKCAIPAIVRDVYGGSYQAMSGFRAFLGLGFIVGAVGVATVGEALRSDVAITWGLFGIAASIGVFAISVFLPAEPATLMAIGAVGSIGAGACGVTVMASFNALLQRIVADRFRGRVFGLKDLCATGALLTATGFLGVPAWTKVDRWVGYILIGVSLLTLSAGFLTIRIRLRRSSFGPWITMLANLNDFLVKFWWRFRRVGPLTVPRDGPVLITANHRCSPDPLFLLAAVRFRLIGFLVAAEYTNVPILQRLMDLLGCIPTRRGTRDTSATKHALRHLRAGKALGIFIEGGIVAPGEPVRPKDGVAMLALKTGAPVIPAYISGAVHRSGIVSGLLTRHRIRVRFGKPVDLSGFRDERMDRETIRRATAKIYAAVLALAPPEERTSPAHEAAGAVAGSVHVRE